MLEDTSTMPGMLDLFGSVKVLEQATSKAVAERVSSGPTNFNSVHRYIWPLAVASYNLACFNPSEKMKVNDLNPTTPCYKVDLVNEGLFRISENKNHRLHLIEL
jgi:hypothetical protein